MGLIKTTVLLGFTLAAYNLDRIRSFKAKHGLDDDAQVVERPKQRRARRRSGTWTEIIESGPAPRPRSSRLIQPSADRASGWPQRVLDRRRGGVRRPEGAERSRREGPFVPETPQRSRRRGLS